MSEAAYPYFSPITPALYPTLATLLTLIGVAFLGSFFVYELRASADTSGKSKRNLFLELNHALLSSVFLGLGVLFLLLWAKVYV